MSYEVSKRILDVTLAVVLIILFSPVMVIVAIAIKLTSPGPVLADTPKRVGKDNKLFSLYKFRSMIVNAHEALRTDPKLRKLYQEYKASSYKLFHDPRVTPVGRFIRKYSLDELPQFFNVLRGEMSIVGPRAYFPDELVEQQEKYPHTRDLVTEVLSVKPGITGFWQVSGRSQVNFDKRIEMDAYYARKRSLLFDILVLLRTPWAMLSAKGAV